MLCAINDSRLQGAKVRVAFVGGEDELSVEHRGLAAKAVQRLRQERQAFGPLVAALAVEPELATTLHTICMR